MDRLKKVFNSGSLVFILVALYVVMIFPAVKNTLHYVNPDGIVFARLSEYLLAGNFSLFITSYWGPLLPLSTIPLFAFSLPTPQLLHIAISLWGLVSLYTFWRLLKSWAISPLLALACSFLFSLLLVRWVTADLTPDIPLTAILLMYFATTSNQTALKSKKQLFTAGLIAGLGFLAKSFVLPFFLLHILLSIIIANWKSVGIKKVAQSFFVAVAGFAVLAAPWVIAMSIHYGNLTLPSSGKATHSLTNPSSTFHNHPLTMGLWTPPEPRLTVWEDPQLQPYEYWSPFDSMKNLAFQIKLTSRNFVLALKLSSPGFKYSASIMLLFLLLWVFLNQKEKKFYLWVILTSGLYLFLYASAMATADSRYFWPLIALLLAATIKLSQDVYFESNKKSIAQLFVLLSLAVATLLPTAYQGLKDVRYILFFTKTKPVYEDIGNSLTNLSGKNFASNAWKEGLYLSYYIRGAKYLGIPDPTKPEQVANADVFLSWAEGEIENPDLTGWQVYGSFEDGEGRLLTVFVKTSRFTKI